MTSYSFTLCSDLHGWKPALPGGDVLIIAGDLVAHSTQLEYDHLRLWLDKQDYQLIILTPGNHDTLIARGAETNLITENTKLLIDSGYTWNDINFYATPWTLSFPNMNPLCKAYTVDTEEQAFQHFKHIPPDTHVLVSHSPLYSILDANTQGENCGSIVLRHIALTLPNLKLHVFGHIHEAQARFDTTLASFINASSIDHKYTPRNPPYTQYNYVT